jgi:hypothetical protein
MIYFSADAGCPTTHTYAHCIDVKSLYGVSAYATFVTLLLSLVVVRMVRRRGRGNGISASPSAALQTSQEWSNVFFLTVRIFNFIFAYILKFVTSVMNSVVSL